MGTHIACSPCQQLLTKGTSKMVRGVPPQALLSSLCFPSDSKSYRHRQRAEPSRPCGLHPLMTASVLRDRAAVLGPGPTMGTPMCFLLWSSRVSYEFKSVGIWRDPIMCLAPPSTFQPKETSRVARLNPESMERPHRVLAHPGIIHQIIRVCVPDQHRLRCLTPPYPG